MMDLYLFAGMFFLTVLVHPTVSVSRFDYFVLGYFAHNFFVRLAQDKMGLEKYIEYCNENWIDYDYRLWWVCIALVVLAYIVYKKLEKTQ